MSKRLKKQLDAVSSTEAGAAAVPAPHNVEPLVTASGAAASRANGAPGVKNYEADAPAAPALEASHTRPRELWALDDAGNLKAENRNLRAET